MLRGCVVFMKGKEGRRRESNLKKESPDGSVGVLRFCFHLSDGKKEGHEEKWFWHSYWFGMDTKGAQNK